MIFENQLSAVSFQLSDIWELGLDAGNSPSLLSIGQKLVSAAPVAES